MDPFAQSVVPILIEDEMRSSYMDYSMSVIIGRALPDVRDGFKPVHRRILYAMHGMGLQASKKYSKCAGVVGEVLKRLHPHGDSPSTTRSSAWPSRGTSGTCWSTARATSAASMATRPPPTGTPNAR
jgi:hypothetical protein